MAKRGPTRRGGQEPKENKMPEPEIVIGPPTPAENLSIEIAQPTAPEPVAPSRKRYGSFYEAWPNVAELRKWTTQQGQPRLGMKPEDVEIANKLIEDYKNG